MCLSPGNRSQRHLSVWVYQINKSAYHSCIHKSVSCTLNHLCSKGGPVWLSQIYISCTPKVSISFPAPLLCFRRKCFLFEGFQTKSIARDSPGKKQNSDFHHLGLFLSLQPKPSKPGFLHNNHTNKLTKSSLCIWRMEVFFLFSTLSGEKKRCVVQQNWSTE